jgi:hypothetical protein
VAAPAEDVVLGGHLGSSGGLGRLEPPASSRPPRGRATIGDVRGRISAIESTATVLDTPAGERVRVPNSRLIAGVVTLH